MERVDHDDAKRDHRLAKLRHEQHVKGFNGLYLDRMNIYRPCTVRPDLLMTPGQPSRASDQIEVLCRRMWLRSCFVQDE